MKKYELSTSGEGVAMLQWLRKFLIGTLIVLATMGVADAKGHHRVHKGTPSYSWNGFDYRWHSQRSDVHVQRKEPHVRRAVAEAPAKGNPYFSIVGTRPNNCFGIAWCGCWMRTQVSHDPGSNYNLAANWANFGHSATLQPGSIVVKAHHVERVERVLGDNTYIAAAGNTGHGNNATTYPSSLRGAIAIRAE